MSNEILNAFTLLIIQVAVKWTPLSRPIFAFNKLTVRRVCV